ncbi:hypothetical protein SASPL_106377 [Salvia splendens]|uniref:Uncharacterized protein n=1 Tax=Salvia splendens TaxID=180675 RepID=A0A8X8YRC8_SALSN|nr:uncharacterized protein DDB_G0290685-like [Salvia splendens]XP_042046844.1 uncharacterized protein DDB_G0290685-like [Salvia splendens]KAG6434735.1 hypothetical protein SASPL_106377 [Salvia splendens]
MEGGERKEAAALPSDYVSLAQLQERWLQKQEETKLKQKREEEEKRERDALALKRKQEREERERYALAQNGRRSRSRNQNQNQNQRGGAKIGGGFVRTTGEIQEKGKEIVCGGPGDGGENNKNIGKKGGKRKKKKNFKGAAAIEEREKVGAGAEVLSGEGGSGVGSSAVELVGCVSVVEVLPRNGEVAHVNRSDLRGGFKKNGRDKGSHRVNELKQSEEEDGGKKCSESEKGGDGGSERGVDRVRGSEEEGERRRGSERWGDRRNGGERWGERGVDRGRRSEEERDTRRGRLGWGRKNGGNPEGKINILKEYRPDISKGNEVELKLQNKADQDEISEFHSGIASLRVGDVNETRGRDKRAKEDGAEGGGSNMDKVAVEFEKKEDRKVLARKGENRGSWKGYRAIGIQGHDNKVKEGGVEGECSNGEIVAKEIEKKVDHKVVSRKGENRCHGRGYRENRIWGRENKAKEDGVEGGGSNGEEVAVEIEKNVDHKVLPRKGENRSYGRGYQENEISERENKAKEDGFEGRCLNGEDVAVEIEKEVDHKVLPRKGENRSYGRGYRENEIWERENKAKEDGVEGGGSSGEEVAVEIEKKVNHKVLPRNGENRSYGRAYQEYGICGPENRAKEDGVDGGGTNSETLAVEIAKNVDHKVLPRKGENGSFRCAYPANANWGRAFGRGMSHTRPRERLYDDFSMKPRERIRMWVKKEDKLNA